MPRGSRGKRTEQNVIDSDGAVILSHGPLTGDSLRTFEYAKKHKKPCIYLDMVRSLVDEVTGRISSWMWEKGIQVLNVVGPRGSKDPDIYGVVKEVLTRVFTMNRADTPQRRHLLIEDEKTIVLFYNVFELQSDGR